jgi:hypothetical protein
MSAKVSVRYSVAIVLLAKGVSETLSPLISYTLTHEWAYAIQLLTLGIVGAVAGGFLPVIIMFDPKAVLKDEVLLEP